MTGWAEEIHSFLHLHCVTDDPREKLLYLPLQHFLLHYMQHNLTANLQYLAYNNNKVKIRDLPMVT